jgi:hypothetical protein
VLAKMMENQRTEILQQVKDNLEAGEKVRQKQRFDFNLRLLLNYQANVLHNREFVANLLYALSTSGELTEETIEQLGRVFGQIVASPDATTRERSIANLSIIGTRATANGNNAVLGIVAEGHRSWLENETELFGGIEHIYNEFEKLVEWFLTHCYWREALTCLETLTSAASAQSNKTKHLKNLALRSLTRMANKQQLGYLVDSYLHAENESEELRQILICFAEPAVKVLLNRLICNENNGDRLRLVSMISAFGSTTKPLLRKCLDANPPWPITRWLLDVIGNIGDENLFDLVEQTVGHPDERVQLDAIKTILRFDDADLQTRLLRALDIVSDRMKLYILRLLIDQKAQGSDFFAKVSELLRHRERFNDKIRKPLTMVCVACLKLLPVPASIDLLHELLAELATRNDEKQVKLVVNEALQMLKPQVRRMRGRKAGQNEISFDTDPAARQLAHEKLRKIGAEIQLLLARNLVKEAGNLLYDKGLEEANRRDFVTAEMLRDRLVSVDPMALDRAVELGQLIEKAKRTPYSGQYWDVWKKLNAVLGDNAFQAMQNFLEIYEFKPGDMIIEAGETDNQLYFLTSGFINISCHVGSKEIFLQRMQPGDVAGSEHFFSPSVCTVNLIAHSPLQLQTLNTTNYHHLCARFPDFGENLQQYCNERGRIEKLINTASEDRRQFPRYVIRHPIDNELFDILGLHTKKKFRGELQDISRGGYAFVIHIATSENVRLLLGRRIFSSISIANTRLPLMQGIVAGIHQLDMAAGKYCIHVRVTDPILDETLTLVRGDVDRI